MSAAAASAHRYSRNPDANPAFDISQGNYCIIPNSLIEYWWSLPYAERVFLLVLMRRPGMTISQETWANWTGLGERLRLSAIRGLEEKGIIQTHGRGNSARFTYDHDAWKKRIPTLRRTAEKPRTFGRGPTVKSPVSNAHPCCVSNGCELARREGVKTESPLIAIPNPQPVADFANPSPNLHQTDASFEQSENRTTPSNHEIPSNRKQPLVATQNRQPVADSDQRARRRHEKAARRAEAPQKTRAPQSIDQARGEWPESWQQVKNHYGNTAQTFLCQLVPELLDEFPDLMDQDLAEALRRGYKREKMRDGPGLWLRTVPDALRGLRTAAAAKVEQEAAEAARYAPGSPAMVQHWLGAIGEEYRRETDQDKRSIGYKLWDLMEKPLSEIEDELKTLDGGRVWKLLEGHKAVK